MLTDVAAQHRLVLIAARRREPEPELHPVEGAVRPRELEVGPNDRLQRHDQIAPVVGRPGKGVPEAGGAFVDERVEQPAFASEVVVERRLGDPSRVHDLLDADSVIAALAPKVEGTGEDYRAVVHGRSIPYGIGARNRRRRSLPRARYGSVNESRKRSMSGEPDSAAVKSASTT